MIPTRLDKIAKETLGDLRCLVPIPTIEHVCIDSRGVASKTLFIALQGRNTDGHCFLAEAFRNGAAAALVAESRIGSVSISPDWPIIVVSSTLRALQLLAKWYRRKAIGEVVAITGSNGKTVVKDALKAFLIKRSVIASPGSYNSQLGLPLSILSAEQYSRLAVLEAGVSAPGEMATLEEIASPDYGILTNIGMAHFASFGSREAIALEKMALFRQIPRSGWVLLPNDEPLLEKHAEQLRCEVHRVGSANQALSLVPFPIVGDSQMLLEVSVPSGARFEVPVQTRSPEIISDLHFAAYAAYLLGVELDEIASALDGFVPTPTRLEIWSSSEGIRIINDAHSSDPISVQSALKTAELVTSPTGRKFFAFGGMRELGTQQEIAHRQVGTQAGESGFSHIFLVGNGNLDFTAQAYKAARPDGCVVKVHSPAELKDKMHPFLRAGDTVLFKGPRNAGMIRAAQDLSGSIAQRCLWVDLAKIAENVARLRRHCGQAEIIATLKALAYGTELVQLAFWMSRIGVRHFGVSSTNEGVAIRKTGVDQEIYIFLADQEDVQNLVFYRLTPIIYSAELADAFATQLAGTGHSLDVHLKVDTGMHRLGVSPADALDIARRIRKTKNMRLTGVCTHFASADDPAADDYTNQQIAVFDHTLEDLRADGFLNLKVHAANTAAAIRFPQAHYDMVRLGLGLYGVFPSAHVQQIVHLELAIAVTSRIAAIRTFEVGDRLGYSGTHVVNRKTRVGIVPFGYDDGLPWRLSGNGHVLIDGKIAAILGRISMDQMQVDVTDISGADVGTEVLIYGSRGGHVLRPEKVAEQAGTIPHELLIRLGKRIHRIYIDP